MVIIYGSTYNITYILFSTIRKCQKRKFHRRSYVYSTIKSIYQPQILVVLDKNEQGYYSGGISDPSYGSHRSQALAMYCFFWDRLESFG